MRQLGNIDFVESQVRRIAAEADAAGVPTKSGPTPPTASLTTRYHIALDTKKPLVLGKWLINHPDDPALKVLVFRNNYYQGVFTRHNRTSSPTSSNTFTHASTNPTKFMTQINTRISSFETALSISTRSCGLTLRHTTLNATKISSTFHSISKISLFTTLRKMVHTHGLSREFLVSTTQLF